MSLSRRSGARFQGSIWPGFVDAMTGLLLVLMFVLTIFMVVQYVLRETISGQETELNELSAEVAALADALGLERDKTAALEGEVGTLRTTLSTAQDQSQAQAALIASLTAERDARISDLDAAQTRITSFEAQVAALLSQRDGALQRVSDLEGTQAELESERDALNAAIAAARSEVDAQEEAARLAAAKREALEALVSDLEAQNSEVTNNLNAVIAQLAQNEDAQAVTQADLEAAKAELKELQAAQSGTQSDLAVALARASNLEAQLSEEEKTRLAEAAAAEALRERLKNSNAELTAMTLALEEQRKNAEETLTLLAAANAASRDLDDKLAAALLLQATNEADLAQARKSLEQATAATIEANEKLAAEVIAKAALQASLNASEAALEAASAVANTATSSQIDLRDQLEAALAAKLAAEQTSLELLSQAEQRAALLRAANEKLADEEAISAAGQRQMAVLSEQIAALRTQMASLQGLLDVAEAAEVESQIQLQALGTRLNSALAQVAAEERQRRLLEEAERKRLEAETKDLAKYRSEFFGQLRDLLGTQEGVRIEGDRFVFSSEVLFPPGSATLSTAGQGEIAKIASILRNVANDIPNTIDWVIRVDGHTDNVPLSGTGQFRDNWELSQARSLSVVKYMVNFLGIPPDRLAANGFGQYQPVDTADTDEARAQNRRIELKFTEK